MKSIVYVKRKTYVRIKINSLAMLIKSKWCHLEGVKIYLKKIKRRQTKRSRNLKVKLKRCQIRLKINGIKMVLI